MKVRPMAPHFLGSLYYQAALTHPTMTHDELITVARTHTADFPELSGEPWANLETDRIGKGLTTTLPGNEPNA